VCLVSVGTWKKKHAILFTRNSGLIHTKYCEHLAQDFCLKRDFNLRRTSYANYLRSTCSTSVGLDPDPPWYRPGSTGPDPGSPRLRSTRLADTRLVLTGAQHSISTFASSLPGIGRGPCRLRLYYSCSCAKPGFINLSPFPDVHKLSDRSQVIRHAT
jgi:hypothetical protein